jgi:hypothetical protein
MNLPPLTAEVSLYQSNGHYRTNAGTSLVRSSTPRIASIYPTQTTWAQPTEVITVYGTAPVGGGTITFPGGGGTLGGGTGSGGTGSGGKTGGKKRGNGRDGGDYNPVEGDKCCGGDGFERGSYHFDDYFMQWGCQERHGNLIWGSCEAKNGTSEFCKDGWCFPVASVPPITGIAQG